jgi:hypothetical protein
MQHLPEIFLWLFIINLGTAFGAGLYETRIILPQWFTKTPGNGYTVNTKAMNDLDTGRKFWVLVTTLPLTLLTIANLVVAIQSTGALHNWWLAAALIVLVERISTFTFFIPTIIRLSKADTLPAAKVSNMVSWWIGVNYVRCLLTLLGMLAAMQVLRML